MPKVELHAHQAAVVDKLGNGKILCGRPGSGKSITAMAYYVTKVCKGLINEFGTMRTPKDVYVITTAKKRDTLDWEEEAFRFGVTPNRENSIDNTQLVVDSWNNINKYRDVKDAFFIFDEQRVVGYGAWSRAFIEIAKSNEWILLSATPGDTWLDYIPVFIANGWYRNKTDFTNQHVVWVPRVQFPKVQRYVDSNVLVRRRNQVLVLMPYAGHTKRHRHDVICDFDEVAFEKVVKKRWHVFEHRPLRDVAELFSVMRKVVNSDESRIQSVTSLLEKHPRLIVFYNFDYELEMLRTLSESDSSTKREKSGPMASSRLTTYSPPWTPTSPGSESSTGETSRTSRVLDSSLASPSTTTSDEQLERSSTRSRKSGPSTGDSFTNGSTPGTDNSSTPESPATALTPTSVLAKGASTKLASTSAKDLPAPAADFVVAEWNGHKHEEVPTTERWLYLVQYRAGAEGWNCISTDAICFYSQTYSYRDWWQAHGRIDRLNTPYINLHYYYLISRSVIDRAIRKALLAKKSFNERSLKL